MKNILFILAIALAFSSCKKEILIAGDDYLKFGTFNGFCVGPECVKLYVLEEDKLYEDPNDFKGTKIGFVALRDEKFNQVKDQKDFIPKELFKLEKETFGCPDCADQGGLYVQYKLDGKIGEFSLDTNIDALPYYLQDFAAKIKEKTKLLK